MALKLVLNLEQDAQDLLDGYGAGAVLSIERDTAADMASATEVGTEAIVAGQQQYEWWDSAGDENKYYRTRVRDSGSTLFSDYSAVFRGEGIAAYATINDVVQTMDLPNQARYALLQDLLEDTSAWVDDRCGRRFLREPQVSGDGTKYLDVKKGGERSLSRATYGAGFTDGTALDIQTVTTLRIRYSESDAYTTLTEGTDFFLTTKLGNEPDWPFEDIMLSLEGELGTWPIGLRAVEFVGVTGFLTVPHRIRRMVADSVREQHRQAVLGAPQTVGVNAFGTPVVMTGQPITWRDALEPLVQPYVKRSLATL